MTVRLLLVEDDRKLARSLTRGLREEGFEVEQAFDGDEGLARMASADVCVLDGALPGLDGFDVLSRARQAGIAVPVLMLTARDATSDRVRGLDAGADDYVVKPFAFEELVARIRAVLRRAPAAGALVCGALRLDPSTHRVTCGETRVELSQKQFALLAFLMTRGERVASRDEILREVWGYDFDPGTNVVDVHVASLRQKLEAAGARAPIRTVRGTGYAMDPEGA